MKLKFYGAAGEVGRSCIMIESGNTRIILDAGIKLGEKEERPLLKDEDLGGIDGVVLTHAHLDHYGYIPHLFSNGINCYVYSTKPTFELTTIGIADYLELSKPKEVTDAGVKKMQKHFKIIDYHKEFRIKDLRIKFIPAGHILGSSMVEISDNKHRLLYTGDLNLRKTRLLNAAYTEGLHFDTLITESTYGGDKDIFPPERTVITQLLSGVKDTLLQAGKVIIPSFGVGRSQEMLLILDDYMHSGIIPKVPIYVDGVVNKVLRIHRHNVMFCREELQRRILMGEDDPFKSANFFEVKSKKYRSDIMKKEEACIIVTTSGMLTGGPVLGYLERLAKDSKNKVILVGYQAEGTRGRALQDGAREIEIRGKKVAVNLKVETYHLSAHADRAQLMKFIKGIKGLKNIFIVHGEKKKQEEFYDALKHEYKAHIPMLESEHEL